MKPSQWFGFLLAVSLTLVSLGYNWRRVDEVSARQQSLEDILRNIPEAIGSTYVRQDVNHAQFEDIQRQLNEIKGLLKENKPR